jgi:hypothetical protein
LAGVLLHTHTALKIIPEMGSKDNEKKDIGRGRWRRAAGTAGAGGSGIYFEQQQQAAKQWAESAHEAEGGKGC